MVLVAGFLTAVIKEYFHLRSAAFSWHILLPCIVQPKQNGENSDTLSFLLIYIDAYNHNIVLYGAWFYAFTHFFLSK